MRSKDGDFVNGVAEISQAAVSFILFLFFFDTGSDPARAAVNLESVFVKRKVNNDGERF